jgi:PTH1 family peptidyl-tRNA hydrolase
MGLLRRLFGRSRPASPAAAPPPPPEALIVGLGNPGRQYAATRHNVGWAVVDRLADRLGVAVTTPEADALVAHAAVDGAPVLLAKPQLYMNRSGGPLAALLERYGLAPEAALVVYDDLALPIGALRLRPKGGAGGHNGVQSIVDTLGSTEFPRLRVGVGDSFAPGQQVAHVLSPFAEDEREAAAEAVALAAEAALTFVRDGMNAAMNRHNRRG